MPTDYDDCQVLARAMSARDLVDALTVLGPDSELLPAVRAEIRRRLTENTLTNGETMPSPTPANVALADTDHLGTFVRVPRDEHGAVAGLCAVALSADDTEFIITGSLTALSAWACHVLDELDEAHEPASDIIVIYDGRILPADTQVPGLDWTVINADETPAEIEQLITERTNQITFYTAALAARRKADQ